MQYAEALKVLATSAKETSLGTETISVSQALSRRASQDLVATLTIPPFDNSSVDGYCFSAIESNGATSEKPIELKIVGTLFPGDLPPESTPANSAWEIMTGAPFPKDCDCSVKVEETPAKRNEQGHVVSITLSKAVTAGENVRRAGADFAPGVTVVSKGEKIRAEHLMALAANGLMRINVYKRPRVVVVPTGAELVAAGDQLKAGQIYNSTEPYLIAALSALGCEVESKPIIRDDPQAFETLLKSLKKNPPDILITTGAVSMGKADFVRPGLEAQGAVIKFHRVEIRPGKPILFSKFAANTGDSGASAPFVGFGLPGNPVSSVIGVRFFVEPYLRALMGIEDEKPLMARLEADYQKPTALRCFLKARYEVKDMVPTTTILSGQPSFMTKPLLQASAWAIVPEGLSEVAKGELIAVYPQTSDF